MSQSPLGSGPGEGEGEALRHKCDPGLIRPRDSSVSYQLRICPSIWGKLIIAEENASSVADYRHLLFLHVYFRFVSSHLIAFSEHPPTNNTMPSKASESWLGTEYGLIVQPSLRHSSCDSKERPSAAAILGGLSRSRARKKECHPWDDHDHVYQP